MPTIIKSGVSIRPTGVMPHNHLHHHPSNTALLQLISIPNVFWEARKILFPIHVFVFFQDGIKAEQTSLTSTFLISSETEEKLPDSKRESRRANVNQCVSVTEVAESGEKTRIYKKNG